MSERENLTALVKQLIQEMADIPWDTLDDATAGRVSVDFQRRVLDAKRALVDHLTPMAAAYVEGYKFEVTDLEADLATIDREIFDHLAAAYGGLVQRAVKVQERQRLGESVLDVKRLFFDPDATLTIWEANTLPWNPRQKIGMIEDMFTAWTLRFLAAGKGGIRAFLNGGQ